jgi:hypothetical protein
MSKARDIANLSTVEVGADITDTTNVTSAGALMDSEVDNLADVKSFDPADYATASQGTLADSALQNINNESIEDLSDVATMTPSDGQLLTWNSDTSKWNAEDAPVSLPDQTDQSGKYLTTDGTDASWDTIDLSSKVSKSGDTMTGNLNFGDNDKAVFGAGSDLEIFHDGNNSYIKESGTGSLLVRGVNLSLQDSSNGENYLVCQSNNEVSMYFDGAKKLATTSTGVDVTGTVTADGLTVENTSGSKLSLKSTTTALSGGETIGDIEFYSSDASGIGAAPRANITVLGSDAAGAGEMYFKTTNGGSSVSNRMLISSIGDISFYEDTGTTAKFFWDASAERLTLTDGVSLSDPSNSAVLLSAEGDSAAFINIRTSDTGDAGILFGDSTDDHTGSVRYDNEVDDMYFMVDNAERMRIDSTGKVGIGTDSPSSTLDVTGTITSTKLEVASGTPVIDFIDTNSANVESRINGESRKLQYISDLAGIGGGEHIFKNGSAEAMRIDSDGNVGIGTSNPSAPLDVYNDSPEIRISNSEGKTWLGGDEIGRFSFWTRDASGIGAHETGFIQNVNESGGTTLSGALAFGVADYNTPAAEAMRIDKLGNVGIGTDNPAETLHITNESPTLRLEDTSGTGSYHQFSCGGTNGEDFYLQADRGGTGGDFIIRVNGISERMRIDSSGNVGIGTSSPDSPLNVATSGGTFKVKNFGASGVELYSPVTLYNVDSGQSHRWAVNSTEAMRIDSSGNLLVGKTSADISQTGHEFRSTGLVWHTVDGDEVLGLNRLTSDGEILQFRKDGSTVGSIGATTFSGASVPRPYMVNHSGEGLAIHYTNSTNAAIVPISGSVEADGFNNLGDADHRWKNLYLSGGVYLGGTGSANHLDDYETGTFTATLVPSTGTITLNTANDTLAYEKIGDLVHVHGFLSVSSVSSPSGGLTMPMPFTNSNTTETSGVSIPTIAVTNATVASGSWWGQFVEGGSSLIIYAGSGVTGGNNASTITASTGIYLSLTYRVA